MVFMDEFLFFDPRALPVILPTLANGAALVLTSSIAPNVADDLMRMLDVRYEDGTRVVNVLNWIVACGTCKKRGQADRCTHVNRRPQHFQKASHQERQRALMSIFSGAFEREMLNVPDEPTRQPAFDLNAIQNLLSVEHTYSADNYVPRVFISIDPNGGSYSSDMVLTSVAYVMRNGQIHPVITGFESCSTCEALKYGELVEAHILELRRLPGFEHAMVIVIVESNLPGISVSLSSHLAASNVANVMFMREDRIKYRGDEIRPGSRTTHENKVAMIEGLKTYIAQERLMVHRNFVVSRPEFSQYTNMQDQMLKELRSFNKIIKLNPRDPSKRATFVYHGKSNGGRDDFVMSLAINIYHHSIFMTDPRYAMYRQSPRQRL